MYTALKTLKYSMTIIANNLLSTLATKAATGSVIFVCFVIIFRAVFSKILVEDSIQYVDNKLLTNPSILVRRPSIYWF